MTTELPDINVTSLQAAACTRSFYYFLKHFWNEIETVDLIDNWHIEYLCNHLQGLIEDIITGKKREGDLCINISPNATKSRITSIFLPVWAWIKDPSLKIITASHSHKLVKDLCKESRRLIRSEKFKMYFPNIEIQQDSDTDTDYHTTKGGRRFGCSVGSPAITGVHGDVIICDDLVDTDATENEILNANSWMTKSANRARRNKDVSIMILIMQRVSHKDPTAELLRIKDTHHICIPAKLNNQNKDTVKPHHLIDNYTEINGEWFMDVNRLGPETLLRELTILRSHGFTTQYLQQPESRDDGIIKRDWIVIQNKTAPLLTALASIEPHFYIDSAYTQNITNDPSAMVTVKLLNNQLYVLNAQEWWLEFPELIKTLTTQLSLNGYINKSKVYIEDKASGKSLKQQLTNQTKYNAIEYKNPKGSKDDRLNSVSPIIESGRVIFVEGQWNEDLIQQLISSNPSHDDMRDCLVMAINNLLIDKSSGTGNYAVGRTKVRR